MDIVDGHCHVISADEAAYPRTPLGGKQSKWAGERPLAADQMLAQMDAVGITQAVLVQATTAYGYDNSYVLDSASEHVDRFTAVGTFNPLAAGAAARLEEGIRSGLAGVRLFTTGSTVAEQGLWFADDATDEFWAAAAAAGLPVCLQLRLGADTRPALASLLARFPDTVVLLDHCGYPDVRTSPDTAAEELAELAAYPGLHLKLTHRTLEGLDDLGERALEFLTPLIGAYGSRRITWGSNCPAAQQSLAELRALAERVLAPLAVDQRVEILGGTARRLYTGLKVS